MLRSTVFPGSTGLRGLLVAASLPILAASACGGGRGDLVPPGLTFAGASDQVVPILEHLKGMAGTPAAREANRLESLLADCQTFFSQCSGRDAQAEQETATAPWDAACDFVATLQCADDGLPDWVAELRGDAGWVFAGSLEPGRWLVVRGTTAADGSVRLDGEAYPAGIKGPVSLLLPAERPAGPPRLSSSQSLAHIRLRPDGGLNLARFLEGGDWGSRLYRLQSKLFEGTALSGVWELAVYPPTTGQRIPPVALALDLRKPELAVEVMEKFLEDLMETWPARRTDYRFEPWTGACLSNVRVMPDLAPCYVATDRALVIGWNAESLEHALGGPTIADGSRSGAVRPWSDAGSEARVYFSRLPSADAVLAETSGTWPVPPSFYPWELFDVRGRRGEDSYLFDAELVVP